MNESMVLDHEERLRIAQLRSDVAELEELLDDELMFTALDGSIVGKNDDLELHRSGRLRITRMEPIERRIMILGNVAVVSAKMSAAASFDGATSEGLLRYTRVWRERADGYRIVAGHMSVAS
jgi:ketosteroid isomerase-like protein